jgi:hypothetical protein
VQQAYEPVDDTKLGEWMAKGLGGMAQLMALFFSWTDSFPTEEPRPFPGEAPLDEGCNCA